MFSILKKSLMWVVAVCFGLVLVLFSLANRGPVTIDLWPLPLSQQIPMFMLLLGCLAFGILWGGFAAWLAAGKARKRAREANRRADAAELEIRHLEERSARLEKDLKDMRQKEKQSRDQLDSIDPKRLQLSSSVDAA